MKCKEMRELLSAYADDELSPQQRELVEKHLGGCSDCRKRLKGDEWVQKQLSSLQEAPLMSNFTRSTISKIQESGEKKNTRTVRRRLLVAVPLVTIVAVVAALYPTVLSLNPEEVIAKAYAATEAVTSFKVTFSEAVKTAGMTSWFDSSFYNIEWVNEDQYHYSTGTYTPHSEIELIMLFDKIYSRESPSLAPLRSSRLEEEIENCINGGNLNSLVSKEYTLAFLDSLTSISEINQERIDGVTCRHYSAQRDVEKIIAQLKERIYQNGGDPSDPKLEGIYDLFRRTQRDVEVWIGKDDYIIRQVTYTMQPVVQGSNLISGGITKFTTKYFDFNIPIVIQPPLDSARNLLPDWMVTERE
ncbi:MAG: zf-HC2 domain-containing protein [Dehalococcoidales bacterium]|nr:zf-HC2 domain-containing protein [Dehalococcoidales bacterium]